MIWIDHVIIAAADLDRAAARLFDGYGLASTPGGRHTGQGTGNRIVPLGRDYIELMGVVDAVEAKTSPLGRWILDATRTGDRLLGWCLATDDLDAAASERGLPVVEMERARPDGRVLRWRLAGLDLAIAEPGVPFFIQWEVRAEEHPGRAEAAHRSAPLGIAWVEVSEAARSVHRWVGDDVPLRVVEGEPGLRRVALATDAGEVILGA
jgi:hypothetical protein